MSAAGIKSFCPVTAAARTRRFFGLVGTGIARYTLRQTVLVRSAGNRDPFGARESHGSSDEEGVPLSVAAETKRMTVPRLRARKGGVPIVVLTAYSTPMARQLDPHVDCLLVGDSVGMVLYGYESTLPVSLEIMIAHGGAVVRGSRQALVVVDLPFGSYQESPVQAFASAARVMRETGCQAVKLEGGREMVETIRFLTERGVPVMGHVGLTPQSIHCLGGYNSRGRDAAGAERILADAEAVAAAGAFAMVVEGVVQTLAVEITRRVNVPTIGIGASPACDGQVLVSEDMLGLFTGFRPKFVKAFAELAPMIDQAVRSYAEDVRTRRFPGPEQCYSAAGQRGAGE